MQIRKKGLDIDIVPPPVELRTQAFIDVFPLGKVPVLELDDGSHIPDSWVIMEYLEEVTPSVSLCPDSARARAQMQLLARYADTYLSPGGLFPLFSLVGKPAAMEGAQEQLVALDNELARLERLLAMLPPFAEREIHLGDIALVPAMDYVQLLTPLFGKDEPLAEYPLAAGWWDKVIADPAIAETSQEMRGAVAKFFGG
jgi:glutathione S-transferase